jgi:hypothetical protein
MYEIPIAIDCSFIDIDIPIENVPISEPVTIKIIPEIVIPITENAISIHNRNVNQIRRYEYTVLNIYKICNIVMSSFVIIIVVTLVTKYTL